MKRKRTLLIITAIIVVAELGLRIFFEDRLRIRQTPICYTPDSLTGYRYIPNSDGEIKWPGISHKFHINNQGFYGPDFNEKKKNGTYRICVIGSSFSNGVWTNGDSDYTMYLQQLFVEDSLKNVEVINCAIDGGRRFLQEVNLVKYTAKKYKPDLILFNTTQDTKWRFYSRENYRGYQLRYSPFSEKAKSISKAKIDELCSFKFTLIEKIYNSSYIIRYFFRGIHYDENKTSGIKYDLRSLLEKEDNTENHIAYYFLLQTFEGALTDLNSELHNMGIQLILLDFGYNEQMNLIAKTNQLNILSLQLNLNEYEMKYDGHPTQEGHMAIADKLHKLLINNKLVN
jgi:hypothetical protein